MIQFCREYGFVLIVLLALTVSMFGIAYSDGTGSSAISWSTVLWYSFLLWLVYVTVGSIIVGTVRDGAVARAVELERRQHFNTATEWRRRHIALMDENVSLQRELAEKLLPAPAVPAAVHQLNRVIILEDERGETTT